MDTVMIVGKPAPKFSLYDLKGEQRSLSDFLGKVVIINFWSAECPWSARVDEKLRQLLAEWGEEVVLLTIASNASEPLEMQRRVSRERSLKDVLLDTDQQVATMYDVQITPHMFLIDRHGVLRYRGAFDDTTFRQHIPTRHYLQEALDAVMIGAQPDPGETNPYGCALVRYAPRR